MGALGKAWAAFKELSIGPITGPLEKTVAQVGLEEQASIYEARAVDAEERGDFYLAKRLWAAAIKLREKLA